MSTSFYSHTVIGYNLSEFVTVKKIEKTIPTRDKEDNIIENKNIVKYEFNVKNTDIIFTSDKEYNLSGVPYYFDELKLKCKEYKIEVHYNEYTGMTIEEAKLGIKFGNEMQGFKHINFEELNILREELFQEIKKHFEINTLPEVYTFNMIG
jgi:DUF4097 and DUF4098 domain-containing protein YvlB